MKVHSGVDTGGSGYVRTITGTATNVHDIEETVNLIREDDEIGYGDSGYIDAEKREESQNDGHLSQVEFRTNKWPGSIKMSDTYQGINWDSR